MTALLIDIGNSRVKWGISDGDEFRFLGQQTFSLQCLSNIIKKSYDSIWVSSVASDEVLTELDLMVSDNQSLHVVNAVSAHASGWVNGYDHPEQLGSDRFLAMLAMWATKGRACCVIDCGTAITLDVVDHEGRHRGGLIYPGLRMMRQALSQGTEMLPEVTDAEDSTLSLLSHNTVDAIAMGTLQGVVTLIERSALQLKVQHPEIAFVLTGGDASAIASHLYGDFQVESHLVLKGLQVMAIEESHRVANTLTA